MEKVTTRCLHFTTSLVLYKQSLSMTRPRLPAQQFRFLKPSGPEWVSLSGPSIANFEIFAASIFLPANDFSKITSCLLYSFMSILVINFHLKTVNSTGRHCGGGQVVSVLAFYFDDLSLHPAESYRFSVCKNENKRKEAVVGPF